MSFLDNYAQNFIGKNIKIIKSSNKNLINLEGVVLEETKNTFKIKTSVPDDVKNVLKNQICFIVGTNTKNIIEGKKITKRSEERLKLKVKK
jgi:ribonuclease P protein subunit POP4